MAFLSWQDHYRVGIEHIDREHLHLFRLINAFHDHHRGGTEPRELQRILNDLVQYAEEHFRHEEATMLENDYPGHAAHCRLHEELYLAIFRLSEELAADSSSIAMDTDSFLRNWLVSHILTHDLQFADHLAQRAEQARRDEKSTTPAAPTEEA
ncbi:MAG: hemerythrin family protein [Rhodobacteraceae bacterium]|mgnify:CR=1 FL=1|nr:hemerythrin family protein [Paracoccaceae bacterium]